MINEEKKKGNAKKVDTKEFELPETVFIRDIENRVFQGIVVQCLSQIEGITLVEGNFIDNILGRGGLESLKGIAAEQDSKSHSVNIKVEVNIFFGVPIPEKAEEIQTKIAEEVTRITGLHVSCVHVVFKNVMLGEQSKKTANAQNASQQTSTNQQTIEEEYNDEF